MLSKYEWVNTIQCGRKSSFQNYVCLFVNIKKTNILVQVYTECDNIKISILNRFFLIDGIHFNLQFIHSTFSGSPNGWNAEECDDNSNSCNCATTCCKGRGRTENDNQNYDHTTGQDNHDNAESHNENNHVKNESNYYKKWVIFTSSIFLFL